MSDESMKGLEDRLRAKLKSDPYPTADLSMGTQTRPSYEKAVEVEKAFKLELIERPVIENIEYYFNMLTEGIIGLANRDLKGQELAFYRIKANILQGISFFEICPFIYNVASICDDLTYAVGLSEKNLPANNLGYLPDQVMGVTRLDDQLIKSYNQAIESFVALINQSDIEGIKLIEKQDWVLWINQIGVRIEGFRDIFLDRDPLEGFSEI